MNGCMLTWTKSSMTKTYNKLILNELSVCVCVCACLRAPASFTSWFCEMGFMLLQPIFLFFQPILDFSSKCAPDTHTHTHTGSPSHADTGTKLLADVFILTGVSLWACPLLVEHSHYCSRSVCALCCVIAVKACHSKRKGGKKSLFSLWNPVWARENLSIWLKSACLCPHRHLFGGSLTRWTEQWCYLCYYLTQMIPLTFYCLKKKLQMLNPSTC